jgi:3'(2'), 5'-bisphosphate nucleotidase
MTAQPGESGWSCLLAALRQAPPVGLIPDHMPILLAGVCRAQKVILDFYHGSQAEVGARRKQDASPVTNADVAADAILRAVLAEGMSVEMSAIVSEEHDVDALGLASMSSDHLIRYFIDPLDGTREFLKRSGEFVICMGALQDCLPKWGLIHAPVTGSTFFGWVSADENTGHLARFHLTPSVSAQSPNLDGLQIVHGEVGDRVQTGAQSQKTSCNPLTVLLSGSAPQGNPVFQHLAACFKQWGMTMQLVSMGSALKFCELAAGRADVYVRLGPTSYWDTIAGQALLESVGGQQWMFVPKRAGWAAEPMSYQDPSLQNPPFVAFRPGLSGALVQQCVKALVQALETERPLGQGEA